MVLAKAFVTLLAVASLTGARMMRKDEVRECQAEAVKKWQHGPGPAVFHESMKRSEVQNITFSNPKASGELYDRL
jgi:carboxypeptidase D